MTKSVLDGHAATNPGPYLNDRQRLAALAVQLRDNRAGQYDAMISAYEKLASRYSKSSLVFDAYLVLGDYRFDKADLTGAKGYYRKILD